MARQEMSVDQALELGDRLLNGGRAADAENAFGAVLAALPGNPRARQGRALAWAQLGRTDDALSEMDALLAADPENPLFLTNKGNILFLAGRLDEAIAVLESALGHAPKSANAWSSLGAARLRRKEYGAALDALDKALAIEPERLSARMNATRAALGAGQTTAAVEHARRAAALAPGNPAVQVLLGDALRKSGDDAAAEEAYETALGADPADRHAREALAVLRVDQARHEEAGQILDRLIAESPDTPEYHYNRSHVHLIRGEFEAGWREYEWRRRRKEFATLAEGMDSALEWSGEKMSGGRMLIRCEQGQGDFIQFARFLPELKARSGAELIVETPPALLPLMQRQAHLPVAEWIERSPRGAPLGPEGYDRFTWLLSAPYRLGVAGEFEMAEPYLAAPGVDDTAWDRRLDPDRFNVGLVWAGNPDHPNDARRSIPLSALAPLAGSGNAAFHSLQKGPTAEEAEDAGPAFSVSRTDQDIADFADTAALMARLDLVVTVDTAPAHLAGAMGVPCWIMIEYSPDWRWGLAGDASRWYPSLRLFRAQAPGDWRPVVTALAAALSKEVARSS